jgi:hypothetical protein
MLQFAVASLIDWKVDIKPINRMSQEFGVNVSIDLIRHPWMLIDLIMVVDSEH